MSKTQTQLSAFEPESDTVDVTRTVRLKLQTSERKNEKLKQGIDAYQAVLSFMADRLPSYPPWEWEPRHPHMYHQAKRGLPDDDIAYKTTLAQQAQQQVAEAFKSWRERGQPGDSPQGEFGSGSYLGLRNDDCEIVAHDSGGFGLKASFISYDPLWFGINAGEFQREFLDRVTDDDSDARAGSAELHLHESGDVFAHVTVTWPVESYRADDVNTTVGVDLNTDPLAAVAVWNHPDQAVEDVELHSGSEFHHYRERLKRAKDQAMRDDDLKAIRDGRRNYELYTDHVMNTVSRRIVDLAVEHAPCRIHLEELTHLRAHTDDHHDWPYADLQEKVISKAEEEGLPVRFVDPRDTSQRCRMCKSVSERHRSVENRHEFECENCGYQVHADVNAAVNIAQRA